MIFSAVDLKFEKAFNQVAKKIGITNGALMILVGLNKENELEAVARYAPWGEEAVHAVIC